MDKLEQFIEYAKLHLISLEQDAEKLQQLMNEFENYDSYDYENLELEDSINTGEMAATSHLLSVATDILEGKPVGRE